MPSLSFFRLAPPAAVLFLLVSLLRADGPAPKTPPPSGSVDFTRDIRPLLADNCFSCHGPDAKKRKGGLRLDTRDGLLKHEGLIVSGKPGESELFHRVLATDRTKVMPPPASGKSLSKAQLDLLKRWVEQGAEYREHWAFVPPRRSAVPVVKWSDRASNPVDRFILARLEAEGLAPAAEADKATLLRRVTFDLTGLPPTAEELDAFLADDSRGAYERIVERLLASFRNGEHMARYWLDLARYGDTHGLHLDNYREMWLYRDWVIASFNRGLPYDRFVLEQLAGDLVPEGGLDALVATGFNRAHVTTAEGGSITEEIHIRNVNDRVETAGLVFLGLTVGCARCHDHKFDPVTQRDFYSLSAFFNSLEGSPLDGNAAQHPPVVRVPPPDRKAKLDEVDRAIAALRDEMRKKAIGLVYDDKLDAKEVEKSKRGDFVWIDDAAPAGVQTMTDGRAAPWEWVKAPVYSGGVSLKLQGAGMSQHFFTEAKPGLKIGAGDKLFAHVYLDPKSPPKEIMLQWHTDTWKHRAYWGENLIAFGRDYSTERKKMGDLPAAGKWVRLEVPVAQVGLKPGNTVTGWAFTQQGGTVHWDKAGLHTEVPQSGAAYDTLSAWVRAQRALNGAGLPADILALVKTDRGKRSPEQHARLREYFILNGWSKTQETLAPLRARQAALAAERGKLEAGTPSTYVFRESATLRKAHILKRGEYDQPGEAVERDTPAFLPPLPKGTKDRLALGRWMVADNNPLTARVGVNRFWQQIFGTGLVRTSEDFGTQGEIASHPELLDWLAVEFRESGWDVKHLLRLMVLSSTYRQSSRLTPELLRRDPANRLLARGPRYRLDAEMLRDQALALSGLLVERVGGPSVKPPQPRGVWSAVAYVGSNTGRFTADTGWERVFRRGMYIFWKRTAAPPQMTTFDAPTREACTTRRERTNTPLQALALLNDPQYVECARVLAQRALRVPGNEAARIAALFRLATCRAPDARELAELRSALTDLRAEYAADREAARRLVALGETKADATLAADELAAWTMLASAVLNLDEVLNKN